MPSLAPRMPPTRARRIACANGWNATAPICANFAARARARGTRARASWPASFRCWTGCNVRPVRPAGAVRRRRAAGRRGIQLGRRAGRQAWNTLRQNLRLESDALRHALRVGIGATLAVALSRSFAVNHGYWMSLTLVFILQPYFAATWRHRGTRAGQRRGRDRRLFAGPAAEHAAFRRAGRAADRARHVRRAHGELRPVHVLPDLAVRAGQPYPAGPARTGTGRARQQRAGRRAGAADRLSAVAREAPASRRAGARAQRHADCAGARPGKERRGGGVAAAHRRAAPAGLPGGRQCQASLERLQQNPCTATARSTRRKPCSMPCAG